MGNAAVTALVTVVAVMCHLVAASPPPQEVCEDVIVTDSDKTDNLTFMNCTMIGQAPLIEWKLNHQRYRADEWRIAKHRCVAGKVEIEQRT